MQYDFVEIKTTLEMLEQKKKEADHVQKILTSIQEEIKNTEARLINLMGLQSPPNANTKTPAPASARPKPHIDREAYALHPRFKLARLSDEQLLAWLDQGWSKRKIASHVGVTWGTVHFRIASIKRSHGEP